MIIQFIISFCLNHVCILTGVVLLCVFGLDFYEQNVKMNEDTDKVDLMYRYMWLKMRRRYYDENL